MNSASGEHLRGSGTPVDVLDGVHVTRPEEETMRIVMELALRDAELPPTAIGYVNGHGTATEHGDIAESRATASVFGGQMPISTQKSTRLPSQTSWSTKRRRSFPPGRVRVRGGATVALGAAIR